AEVINIRVQMRGGMPKVSLREAGPGRGGPRARATRRILLDGRSLEAHVYARDDLGRGDTLQGPAIVEQEDTTVLLPSSFTGEVDRYGNLWIRRDG
ncbi:MAG: hydantoinase/oxoprolinase family protein, partial [Candidatus Rokuibacteriota bacterium]